VASEGKRSGCEECFFFFKERKQEREGVVWDQVQYVCVRDEEDLLTITGNRQQRKSIVVPSLLHFGVGLILPADER
jgi:hypothetical protein